MKNNKEQTLTEFVEILKNIPTIKERKAYIINRFTFLGFPNSLESFKKFTKLFFGMELNLKRLNVWETFENPPTYIVDYEILENHCIYTSTQQFAQIKKLLSEQEAQHRVETWVFMLIFGKLHTGGIANSNYGVTKPDKHTYIRIQNIAKQLNA